MRNVLYTFSTFLTFFLAKTLVASLMEVDQDQRLTAQEAIAHEWYKNKEKKESDRLQVKIITSTLLPIFPGFLEMLLQIRTSRMGFVPR